MTKIICVGDIHMMDRPPRNATETYTDDLIDMLTWIAEYAHQHGIKHVVWAGDVFHFKQPSKTSHALVLRMIAVVKRHLELGIELMAVTGNHDISNDVLATIQEKQPLGVLYQAGLRELVGWHETLPLYGVPWRSDWTTNERSAWAAFEEWREARLGREQSHPVHSLAVTHAPIYPPKDAENIQWELVPTMGENGIAAAMGNVGHLYYGHIHEDHGIFQVEGTTFANMGALSRGSLTEYNVNREIKIAVWDEESGFTEVVVPHKPANEVLRVEEAAEKKAEQISLDNFLTDVGHSQIDISSTASVIDHIRARSDVDEKIKRTAIRYLEELS